MICCEHEVLCKVLGLRLVVVRVTRARPMSKERRNQRRLESPTRSATSQTCYAFRMTRADTEETHYSRSMSLASRSYPTYCALASDPPYRQPRPALVVDV